MSVKPHCTNRLKTIMDTSILTAIFTEIYISDTAGAGFVFLLLSVPILIIGLILLIPQKARKVGKIICLIGLCVLLVGGSMCAVG